MVVSIGSAALVGVSALAGAFFKRSFGMKKEQHRLERKARRREYLKVHAFDILNLVIAVLALIIAALGLFLP